MNASKEIKDAMEMFNQAMSKLENATGKLTIDRKSLLMSYIAQSEDAKFLDQARFYFELNSK